MYWIQLASHLDHISYKKKWVYATHHISNLCCVCELFQGGPQKAECQHPITRSVDFKNFFVVVLWCLSIADYGIPQNIKVLWWKRNAQRIEEEAIKSFCNTQESCKANCRGTYPNFLYELWQIMITKQHLITALWEFPFF